MPAIVVVDYDPAWPQLIETLRGPIWNAVSDLAIAIEHVGSTAVPGLAAKPIVDIALVVPRDRVGAAIARLATLGYEHKGDLGIPGREAMRHPPGAPRHHLYVCPEGNLALANQLALRDYLLPPARRNLEPHGNLLCPLVPRPATARPRAAET